MTPDISIIIVNYNSGPHLGECLTSLSDGLAGFNWEVVVVDNASTDHSEAVAEKDESILGVRLVRLQANRGFAAGANLGARIARANCLLFINPDCLVAPGFLQPLLHEVETHPRCAAVAPCVINEDGSPQGNARGDPTMMTGLFGRSTLLSRLFPSAQLARRNVLLPGVLPESQAAAAVDWVSGSCVLVRREAFNQIGGFDERYFLYWEDADLCRRVRTAGWSIHFRSDARVVHVGARSSSTVKPLAIRAFHRSAYVYYATHVAPSRWSARRWLAAGLLFARCRIKLLAARIG
jgi:GT2 family glycosyltransferase